MTFDDSAAIRKLVDEGGWDAVRQHPVYGPIWAKALAEQKAYEARIVEPV